MHLEFLETKEPEHGLTLTSWELFKARKRDKWHLFEQQSMQSRGFYFRKTLWVMLFCSYQLYAKVLLWNTNRLADSTYPILLYAQRYIWLALPHFTLFIRSQVKSYLICSLIIDFCL